MPKRRSVTSAHPVLLRSPQRAHARRCKNSKYKQNIYIIEYQVYAKKFRCIGEVWPGKFTFLSSQGSPTSIEGCSLKKPVLARSFSVTKTMIVRLGREPPPLGLLSAIV